MAFVNCQYQNQPTGHPEKRGQVRLPQQSSPPLDNCAIEGEFDTQEFLSEVRSLTPAERERLIRSYAR
jgi:hypothetical protein